MICNQPGDKIIFGPQKFSDVPEASGSTSGVGAKGRLYKLQFQSPPQVGSYAFRAVFVSDTFVGDDLTMDLSVSCVILFLRCQLTRQCSLLLKTSPHLLLRRLVQKMRSPTQMRILLLAKWLPCVVVP
jgi:hypothetical protein